MHETGYYMLATAGSWAVAAGSWVVTAGSTGSCPVAAAAGLGWAAKPNIGHPPSKGVGFSVLTYY